MPCYHPLKGFAIGKTDKGKTQYKIVSYDVTSVQFIDGNWIPFSGPVFRSDKAQKMVAQSVTIPCGKCRLSFRVFETMGESLYVGIRLP